MSSDSKTETLSSALTFVYKFVFVLVMSGGFGLATLLLFLDGDPKVGALRWQFFGLWVVATVFLWWGCARLKKVELKGNTLLISNYRDQISVPVQDIAAVKQNRWINIEPITITFRKETAFGRKVVFVPPRSLALATEESPLVKRLVDLSAEPFGR